jgi:protein-tyrosine-phosphatase
VALERTGPVRILFLCTHNSARSQIAEAIMRRQGGKRVEVFSAGSDPTIVHPDAVQVMTGWHIDSSRHRSKSLDEFRDQTFDYIITVCDKIRELCPVFPGDPRQIHWSFADPATVEDPAQRLHEFQMIASLLLTRIRLLLIIIDREQTGRAMTESPGS